MSSARKEYVENLEKEYLEKLKRDAERPHWRRSLPEQETKFPFVEKNIVKKAVQTMWFRKCIEDMPQSVHVWNTKTKIDIHYWVKKWFLQFEDYDRVPCPLTRKYNKKGDKWKDRVQNISECPVCPHYENHFDVYALCNWKEES